MLYDFFKSIILDMLTLKAGLQPGDLMKLAWKAEKLMSAEAATKKLESREETTLRSPTQVYLVHTIDKYCNITKWTKWVVFVIELKLLQPCFGLSAMY